MFFKPTLTAAVLLRAFSPVVFDDDAEKVNFIFSLSGFETVTSPGCGNEIGHNSGFTLTTDQGVELYSNADPWGYSPCMLGGSTSEFDRFSSRFSDGHDPDTLTPHRCLH